MKNSKIKYSCLKPIILTIIIVTYLPLSGQDIVKLELDFQNLNQLFKTEQAKYDSLNIIHKKMISVIDKEKQIDEVNKEKITNLLASTVVISNQIKEQQIKLNNIENKLEHIKKNLDRIYAKKIDSLKTLENSINYSVEKELLKSQIRNFIEKRLIVAPKIYSLSFDPQRLIQINPSLIDDTLALKIYKEYLSTSLSEIDTQTAQLQLLKDEIQDIVYLQNEAADFVEEIDSDILFNPIVQSSEKSTRNENTYLGGEPNILDYGTRRINFQANSYLHIFNQLRTFTDIDVQSPLQTPMDTIPSNLTFQQYLELLIEVEKMLQDYRIILRHKLESN
jgi:hypothetical protein